VHYDIPLLTTASQARHAPRLARPAHVQMLLDEG